LVTQDTVVIFGDIMATCGKIWVELEFGRRRFHKPILCKRRCQFKTMQFYRLHPRQNKHLGHIVAKCGKTCFGRTKDTMAIFGHTDINGHLW